MISDLVRRLVQLKNDIAPDRCPTTFLRNVLPFWDGASLGPAELRHVDPGLVLGARYQGWNPPASPDALMDSLDADAERTARGLSKGFNAAEFLQVGTLDLFVAHEGKNRVELFARHDRTMAALVTATGYPAPDRLMLRQLRPWGGWGLALRSAPNDLRILAFPDLTVALIEEYGVGTAPPVFRLGAGGRRARAEAAALSGRLDH